MLVFTNIFFFKAPVLCIKEKQMKKVDSNELINSLESQVENHLNLAVKKYQNLDEEILLSPAPDGGWSIMQCLDHLNGYGDHYLPAIKKGLEKKIPANSHFSSSWLGSYFTKMMDPATGKKKIKAFKNHIPKQELNAPSVVAEFIRQQEDLLQLLTKSRATDLNKIKVPISIGKWMKLKLGDVFQFLIAHNERHIQQANRVLENIKIREKDYS